MEKPTRSLISFIFILSIPYLILAQNAGDYRSKVASGNWSSAGSWEVFDGTNWVGAATAPNSANGIITIRSPHVITLNSTVTADQIVVESGGSLYINNPGVLNLNDDTGEDLVCSGFIWHTNGTINGPGTIRINSGGTIQLSNGTAQTMVIATTLTNFGTVYWSNNTTGGSSTSTLTLTNGKIINNAAFTVNSTSGPISEKINGGDIVNNGTITYSSSSSVPNFTMNVNKITNNLNASIIANANGALIIQAAVGDTHEGTFTSNSSNGLKFTGAAIQTYTSNCTFNGSGFIEFNQGTHTFNANYNAGSTRITGATTVYNYSSLNFNNLYLSGGTFGGPCVKNMNGGMGWDGGMVSGGDLIIPATKSLAIGGGAYVTWTLACNLTNNGSIGLANANPGCCGTSTLAMSGQTITNNGSFVISYSGYASGTTQKISGGTFINNGILKTTSHINNVELNLSSFVNNQTGLVFAEGNGRLTLNITSGSVNDGDFQSNSTTGMLFTGPAAMTYDINSDFTGSGKFEFQSGTHTLNGAYHGSSTILSGAAINFNMPNVNFNYIALTAGTFSGIGSRTCNNIDWTGGTIAGAPLSQASGSQLNMIVPTSGTTYNLNTTFTCNGNITWTNNPGGSQSSTLNLASGNLINNGTMNINMGVNNTNTISNGQLTNNGIFNRNANGTFNFQSSATLTNTGTLNFFAGSSVLGTQNLGGIINLTSGVFNCNTVNFNGTVLNMTGSALINSSINFNFTGNTLQSFNGDGTSTIERMGMNASGGLIINANQLTVNSTLTYTNGIIYATYGNLVLNGSLVGNGSSTAYVVTNGSAGFLRNLNSIATFTFPVGTTSGFSPIDVQILSTAGQGLHAVRVFDNVYSSYSPSGNGSPAGPSITSAQVNRSWVVWKWNGGTINAKLNLKWLTNEESPDFNRNLCRIAKYDANTNNWTLESQTSGGSGPLFSVASSAQTSFTTSNIYCVIGQFTTATQTIAPQCAGNSISINYKAIGSFTSGNAFTAQLSDANGDFTSAVNIGSLNSTTDGIISCIIPSNTPAGTGYRIRVVSSMPVSKGSDNGSNITIFQSITYYADDDHDGYGDPIHFLVSCSGPPNGYVNNNLDCDDTNVNVHPNATEICNLIDDDCDGLIDDADPGIVGRSTWNADADGDGYGDANNSVLACVQPNGYVSNGNDCNDANASVHPGAGEFCNDYDDDCDGLIDDNDPEITGQPTWYVDADGDGYGDASNSVLACVQPNGYVSNGDDCNDANAAVHPGAGEFCNDYDDDCDGLIDDNDPEITGQPTWYADTDGDGFGDPSNSVLACVQPNGYVSNGNDCNDANATVHPGAGEFCNDYDDDCDGLIDDNDPEITGQPTWYADADGDGFGDVNNSVLACVQPNGYVSNSDDCNDANASVHPGVGEFCNDYDDDCDGLIDDNDPEIKGQPTWYVDADGDGYGDANNSVLACLQPSDYVSNGDDCNDSNSAIHPGAGEFCNGYDDNCDGLIDDNDPEITGQPTWYADVDGDGFGDVNNLVLACVQPYGYVSNGDDCNDSNNAIHPGAGEFCNDYDDDCDGLIDDNDPEITGQPTWYADTDGDGFGDPNNPVLACVQPNGYVSNGDDCNDSNASIHPGAGEFCNDYDDDCDGLIDDNDPEITGQLTWYADTDGDGYGDANNAVLACLQPNGYVSNGDDCNDANAAIHPGAGEFCNDFDDDCDGLIDDNDPEITGQPTWYADTDGDGYGDANNSVLACVQPNGYVSNGDDCNDADAAIHPGAEEICGNNVDENCDNLIDENCCVAPQIINCPSNITIDAVTNACAKLVTYSSASANGTGPITITYSQASGTKFPVGITTVLVTAENNCGIDNCSFNVEVVDNQKPVISCKNITLNLDQNGVAVVNPDLVVLSVYDNCGILSKVTSPAVLDCDHLGSNQVTLIVTDIHNNSSTCIANVNVIDNIKPFAKCKDLTVSLSMSGTVLVQGFELDGGSSDNCEIASYPNSTYILNCNNLGKNNLVMNVFDKSNNSASCISEVTVIDNLGPKVTCNNLTVKLNNGGQANVNVNEIQSSLDNCGVSQIEYKKKFDCTDLGVNNVLVTVSDASGNSSTCNSIVTVSDKILPDAKCKNSNKYVYLKNGYATLSVDDIDQNSKDNCSIVSRTLSQSNFNCSDIGPHSIFLTVTDQSGNSSNCATNVVVIGPMPVCYLNVVPENNINTGGIPTNIYLGYGPQKDTIKCVANGGTGFTYSWSPVSNLSCSTCSQPVFSPATAGNYTYTVTVTNASGCSSTCSVSFCVKDIKVPGSNGSYVYVCHSGVSSLILPLAQVPLHVPGHALDKLGKCTDLCPSTPSTLSNTGVYSMNNQDTNNFSNELAGYANSEFKIYPNPSFDQFIVSNQNYKIQNLKIEVVDLFGRIIETKEWNDNLAEHSFGLHYRSGVYLVKIQSGEMSTVYRVVKQE